MRILWVSLVLVVSAISALFGDNLFKNPLTNAGPGDALDGSFPIGTVVKVNPASSNLVAICDSGEIPLGIIFRVDVIASAPDQYSLMTSGIFPDMQYVATAPFTAGTKLVPADGGKVMPSIGDSIGYIFAVALEGGAAGTGTIDIMVAISYSTSRVTTGGGSGDLQDAYNNGNTINGTAGRPVSVTNSNSISVEVANASATEPALSVDNPTSGGAAIEVLNGSMNMNGGEINEVGTPTVLPDGTPGPTIVGDAVSSKYILGNPRGSSTNYKLYHYR